jgi:hypothetical protein
MSDWGRSKDRAEARTIHSPSGATTSERERLPAVGQHGLATVGLALGLLLVAIQLWLLTVAFDLYLAGERNQTVGVAVASGLVFLGGLGMLRLLNRTPPRRRR